METLISPIDLLNGSKIMTAISEENVKYIDPISHIEVVRNISIVYFGTRWRVYAQAIGTPTTETIEKYSEIQNLIGNCIQLAEILNTKLSGICKGFLNKSSDERDEIHTYDFMKLRNTFSDYLKSYVKIREIEEYNSKKKVKEFTRLFYQFILDRNIYTHGIFRMRKPENDFVLYHKVGDVNTYSLVTKEMLLSFMKVYEVLNKLLDDFIITRQNERI